MAVVRPLMLSVTGLLRTLGQRCAPGWVAGPAWITSWRPETALQTARASASGNLQPTLPSYKRQQDGRQIRRISRRTTSFRNGKDEPLELRRATCGIAGLRAWTGGAWVSRAVSGAAAPGCHVRVDSSRERTVASARRYDFFCRWMSKLRGRSC